MHPTNNRDYILGFLKGKIPSFIFENPDYFNSIMFYAHIFYYDFKESVRFAFELANEEHVFRQSSILHHMKNDPKFREDVDLIENYLKKHKVRDDISVKDLLYSIKKT
jgi:hypothetical protein